MALRTPALADAHLEGLLPAFPAVMITGARATGKTSTAGRIVSDPAATIELAKSNVRRMRGSAARGAALIWLNEWERLLDDPMLALLQTLTSPAARARELRQNNPFAGLLTDEERGSILRTAETGSR